MVTHAPNNSRPYWHVDAKWIAGLLLFFALITALLLFNVSKLTERDSAVTISATVVASLFSKEGLDDDADLEEFRQQAAALPDGGAITPIEDFPSITISKEDALALSPRELRIKIFSQLTGLIYDRGLEGAATEFTNDPAEQERFARQATLLGMFTEATHRTIQKLFWPVAMITLALLAAVVYFSAGLGRLVSPGIIFLAVSFPGAIISLLLLGGPREGDTAAGMSEEIANSIGASLSQSYLVIALLGLALLLAALVGKLIRRKKTKYSR